MNDRWQYRAIGWLGIVNFILVIAPVFIAPVPPFGPGADLVAFTQMHRNVLMVGNYIAVIELPIGFILLVFVSAVTRRAEEHSGGWWWLLVFGSSVCVTTVGVVLGFFFLLNPLIVGLGNSVLLMLTQVGLYGLNIVYVMQALLLAAIGLAATRLRFLPGWLGYIALLFAVLSALGTLGLLVTSGPFSATNPFSLFVIGLTEPLWLLLASIYWLIHPASYEGLRAAAA